MIRIVWLACRCYLWPISPTAPTSRCGFCREYPDTPLPAPADGKARPL